MPEKTAEYVRLDKVPQKVIFKYPLITNNTLPQQSKKEQNYKICEAPLYPKKYILKLYPKDLYLIDHFSTIVELIYAK